MNNYKYNKYKNKYINYKKQYGGAVPPEIKNALDKANLYEELRLNEQSLQVLEETTLDQDRKLQYILKKQSEYNTYLIKYIKILILQKEKLQEEKLQEEKLQEEKLQEEKLQEEKLQEEKLQEEKLQEEKLPYLQNNIINIITQFIEYIKILILQKEKLEILQKLLNISSITEKKTIQEDIYNVEYFIEYIELLISVYEYIINPENNTVIIDNNSILIYTLSSLKEKLKECEEEQQLCNVEYINIMIKKYRYRIISLYQILKPINIYIEKYNSKLEISKYLLSKYTTYKDYIFKNPNTRAFDLLLLTGTDCSKLRDELNVEKEKIKLIGYSKIYNRDDQQLENIELCDINVVEKENEDPNKISNLNIKLKKLSSVDDLYINEIEKEDNSIINELDEKLKKLHDVGYYNTYFTTEITKEEKNIKNLTKIIDEYDLLLDLFINKK